MKPCTKDAIDRYAKEHEPVSSFLQAVFENNLREAFSRADEANTRDMAEIVSYVYNEVPATAWGSPAKVTAWLADEPKDHSRGVESDQTNVSGV
jgi:hypothetical protein